MCLLFLDQFIAEGTSYVTQVINFAQIVFLATLRPFCMFVVIATLLLKHKLYLSETAETTRFPDKCVLNEQ